MHFLQVDKSEKREHLEVSPESALVIQALSQRISEDGGCALIADYGHDGEKGDTFRVSTLGPLYKIYKIF